MSDKAFLAAHAMVLALAGLLFAAGCGAGGPARHHVSGRITFRGEPVPAGAIMFQPDTAQGNRGPAGYATIENGRYNTARSGRGVVGGPHRVIISGFDGMADPSGELPHGAPLFPDYHTTSDLPTGNTTLDFTIP